MQGHHLYSWQTGSGGAEADAPAVFVQISMNINRNPSAVQCGAGGVYEGPYAAGSSGNTQSQMDVVDGVIRRR